MKILGIDTSSKFLSIALSENENILREEKHLLDRKHSSLLVPKIKAMLDGLKLSIDNVDAFVVGLGPGSFTGLRIGVSTIKGFGIATGRPCFGVASIDALAMDVDGEGNMIAPIIDAKRKNIYCAMYRRKNGKISRKSGYMLVGIKELLKKIKGQTVFLGDGISLYKKDIERVNKKTVFLEEESWYPKAGNLIKLALPSLKRHKKIDLGKLNPIYLYPRDCQVRKWL